MCETWGEEEQKEIMTLKHSVKRTATDVVLVQSSDGFAASDTNSLATIGA